MGDGTACTHAECSHVHVRVPLYSSNSIIPPPAEEGGTINADRKGVESLRLRLPLREADRTGVVLALPPPLPAAKVTPAGMEIDRRMLVRRSDAAPAVVSWCC